MYAAAVRRTSFGELDTFASGYASALPPDIRYKSIYTTAAFLTAGAIPHKMYRN
jgi:hypothetical protein